VELIPAIDLVGGLVVRLAQGDFDRQTTYDVDPVRTAQRWAGEGATRLHIVDLDGARQGRSAQGRLIRRIVASVRIPCQVAGGLRDETAVAGALAAGADRVVLGTAVLRDPGLARRLVATHGAGRIVAAIDVRDGMAVGSGWVKGSAGRAVEEVIPELVAAGIALFAVTAIARDGLQEGPDLELLERVAEIVGPDRVIASAGVTNIADVTELAWRGYAGAILGRALYEGSLSLREANAALADIS
jgi:phosphoribosylformimino-5-aminoimidazole carboxamide ribotide isomerase